MKYNLITCNLLKIRNWKSISSRQIRNEQKEVTLAQVYSSELCKIFKNTFLREHLQGTALIIFLSVLAWLCSGVKKFFFIFWFLTHFSWNQQFKDHYFPLLNSSDPTVPCMRSIVKIWFPLNPHFLAKKAFLKAISFLKKHFRWWTFKLLS